MCCKAVRRGVTRALVSCDFPFGPLQEGTDERGARRHPAGQGRRRRHDQARCRGRFPEAVRALARAGIPVFAQFGITPQTALQYGIPYGAPVRAGAQAPPEMTAKLVERRQSCWRTAGASLLDFTNSGPVAGAAVVKRGQDPGDRRLRRRPLARRPRAPGAHRHRLRARNGSTPRPRPTPTSPRPALDAFTALIDGRARRPPDQGLT